MVLKMCLKNLIEPRTSEGSERMILYDLQLTYVPGSDPTAGNNRRCEASSLMHVRSVHSCISSTVVSFDCNFRNRQKSHVRTYLKYIGTYLT